jgi:hypothetical protein
VAVAFDEVDDAEDLVDGGVGDDAVAEAEDVAGAAWEARLRLPTYLATLNDLSLAV